MADKSQISKLISFWLRHDPADANLIVDEFGWVSTSELIKSLQSRGHLFSVDDIVDLNKSFDKVRWVFNDDHGNIRATHGHSINIIQTTSEKPPAILYHGTTIEKVEAILKDGLISMRRQFVHLSTDIHTAIAVAKRHGRPLLLEIDSELLDKTDRQFYKTSENVWLTKDIPVEYLSFKPWETVIDSEKAGLLKQLSTEVTRHHLLFDLLRDLELIMRRHNDDEALFLDKRTNEVYQVHLTWSREPQKSPFPLTEKYSSFTDWIETSFTEDQMDWYYPDLTL